MAPRFPRVMGLAKMCSNRNISFKSLDPPSSLTHGIHVFHCPVTNIFFVFLGYALVRQLLTVLLIEIGFVNRTRLELLPSYRIVSLLEGETF